METLSELLALLRGSISDGFPSERNSNTELFMSDVGLNKLLNKLPSCRWFMMLWHSYDVTVKKPRFTLPRFHVRKPNVSGGFTKLNHVPRHHTETRTSWQFKPIFVKKILICLRCYWIYFFFGVPSNKRKHWFRQWLGADLPLSESLMNSLMLTGRHQAWMGYATKGTTILHKIRAIYTPEVWIYMIHQGNFDVSPWCQPVTDMKSGLYISKVLHSNCEIVRACFLFTVSTDFTLKIKDPALVPVVSNSVWEMIFNFSKLTYFSLQEAWMLARFELRQGTTY